MAKNIQLDLETVENREMRLGSIISWDGKASELVELSRYEERALKHKGCYALQSAEYVCKFHCCLSGRKYP